VPLNVVWDVIALERGLGKAKCVGDVQQQFDDEELFSDPIIRVLWGSHENDSRSAAARFSA
jgi:hypothetical protein